MLLPLTKLVFQFSQAKAGPPCHLLHQVLALAAVCYSSASPDGQTSTGWGTKLECQMGDKSCTQMSIGIDVQLSAAETS